MKINFDHAFALTLRHEGGYVDHPKDPGGATNLGVTIGTLSGWLGRPATKVEVRALTPEKVKPIYRKNYWDAIGADRMEPGFDYACYDLAVNSGVGRAVKLSRAVAGNTPEARIKALCAARLAFLKGLRTWPTFGKGWGRRVAEVEREALRMARATAPRVLAEAPPPQPDDPGPTPKPPVNLKVNTAPQPASAGFFARLIAALFGRKRA